jgi:hypothetical protein
MLENIGLRFRVQGSRLKTENQTIYLVPCTLYPIPLHPGLMTMDFELLTPDT